MDWKEIYKEKIVTADEAMQHIQRGDLIIPGDFGAEPVYLMEHMTKRAGTLGNVKVMHGGNIGPEPHLLSESKEFVDFECLCAVPISRKALEERRADFVPCYFHEWPKLFKTVKKPDVALIQVTEPDENGMVSLGVSSDFTSLIPTIARITIAQVNRNMPFIPSNTINIEQLDYLVLQDEPLLLLTDSFPGEVEKEIARHVVPLIHDGDCLQIGRGKLPDEKLTEELHRRNPEARYADYYELATFNHILSTQHPEHGGYVYFTPARPRHYRNYSAPNEAMWCCVGTGMENHGKYGQFVYTKKNDNLFVNLFVASELNWKERGIVIRQDTQFPYGETSRITITQGKGEFTLQVRYPGWVKPGQFAIKVNGQTVSIVTGPSSYVSIDRKWKKGDVVDITFPMYNSVKYLPNEPQYIALMHGPILLGMKTGTEDLAHLIADDSRFGQYAGGKKLPIDQAPMLINDNIEDIANQLQPVAGKPLHFTLTTKMENAIRNELMPFFEIHDARYMMYWLALSEQSYKSYLDNLARQEQERQALEARTVDKVQPGEQQPETDHKMETDRSQVGNTNDVFFRDARDGHYFSYLMQTGGQTELSLRLKYWGVGDWKTHEFDIMVDDVLVKEVNNTGKYRVSEFKYETYPIPADLLKGKQQVRVKFVAKPGKQIGEIYEVRLVK